MTDWFQFRMTHLFTAFPLPACANHVVGLHSHENQRLSKSNDRQSVQIVMWVDMFKITLYENG